MHEGSLWAWGVVGHDERGPVACFIFDGREFSQPSLLPPSVIGPHNPGRDCQTQFLPGEPPLTVHDDFLSKGRKFHSQAGGSTPARQLRQGLVGRRDPTS